MLTEAAERRAAARIDRVVLRAYDRDSAAVRATLENADARRVREARSRRAPRARRSAGGAGAARPRGREPAVRRAARRGRGLASASTRCSATSCASATSAGRPPCSRAIRRSAASSGSRPSARTRCSTARSNAGCCASTSSRSTSSRSACRARCRRSTPRPRARGRARRCSRIACARTSRRSATWARKEGIACYRVYDADMPEYAFSIDIYAARRRPDAPRFVYVQEYAPPATIEPEKARARRAEAFSVIPEVLDVPRERVYLRTRRKQKGGAQYEKLAERGEFDGGRRRRPRAARELHGLLRHGPVPRSSADARAHSRARGRQERS